MCSPRHVRHLARTWVNSFESSPMTTQTHKTKPWPCKREDVFVLGTNDDDIHLRRNYYIFIGMCKRTFTPAEVLDVWNAIICAAQQNILSPFFNKPTRSPWLEVLCIYTYNPAATLLSICVHIYLQRVILYGILACFYSVVWIAFEYRATQEKWANKE